MRESEYDSAIHEFHITSDGIMIASTSDSAQAVLSGRSPDVSAAPAIVDDEVDIAETLQELLELAGYVVAVAFDGEDGLRKVDESRPDVIVTDIMMPGLTGLEMLEQLRRNPRYKHIPVIVMSAIEREDVTVRFSAAYIKKPFGIQQLTQLLDRLPE
ncbi:MAG TPA: response regulator [Kofleriaceae bacterium]